MTNLDETREEDEAARLKQGIQILGDLLAKAEGGVVSTKILRKELEAKEISAPKELIAQLKAYEPRGDTASGDSKFRHFGRSFYTKQKYDEEQKKREEDAAQAAAAGGNDEDDAASDEAQAGTAPERVERRHEEARLGTYVRPVLEEIYDDDASPDEYVFDVHSLRGGNGFENVDLLAVHWRSPALIEIVTVEVKLKFTSALVQQARNYTRFSERVWIALRVAAASTLDAALELQAHDPLLFEHVVDIGLGILGCHRGPGRGGSYDVFPIHWPRKNSIDPLARAEFVRRYRTQLERGRAAAPPARSYPIR